MSTVSKKRVHPPERGERRLEVLLPPEEKERLQALARARWLSTADLARQAIRELLERQQASAA